MKTVTNNTYKTAIVRDRISRPAKWLKDHGYLKGRVLDYGCGHGQDAVVLKCDKYDPHYFPEWPSHKYSTILCTYVLNVLPPEERQEVFRLIKELADGRGCTVFFSVRTDLKAETSTQYIVNYDWLPVVVDKQGFKIYKWFIPNPNMRK